MQNTARKTFLLYIILAIFIPPVSAYGNTETVVRIRSPQGESDIAHNYFFQLIQMTLEITKKESETIRVDVTHDPITQKRSIELLKSNTQIDTNWFGENKIRRAELGYVDFPLLDGLLGVRMLAIHKADKEKFDSIVEADELKKLVACQGSHWPDSDILEFNGYTVLRIAQFASMYKLLKKQRCDYFPRSITEGYGEIKKLGDDDIIPYDRILIVYPFNMRFFVNQNNTQLIERLEEGLFILKITGELEKLRKEHPASSSAFPLSQYKGSNIFILKNPD